MSPELSPRFTDRARKTMKEAAQVARERRHLAIEPGHVLVALCREGSGVGANMLRNFQVDPTSLSERILGHPSFVMGEESELLVQDIPAGKYTKAVILAAATAAERLGHSYVGTEHLLIALTEVSSVAQEVLLLVGVTTTEAEEELRQLVGDSSPSNSADQAKSVEPTEMVRKAFEFANRVALDMNHERVGTGHVLLGLLKCPDGCGALRVLRHLNVDLKKVSDDMRCELLPCGDGVIMGKLPFTTGLKVAQDKMKDLGLQLESKAISTGHLLVALFHDISVVGVVLMNQGVNAENLNRALTDVLGEFDYVAEETLSEAREVGPGSTHAFFVGVEPKVSDTAEFDSYVANAKRDIESAPQEVRAQVWATLALATALNKIAESVKRICDVAELEANGVSQEKGKPKE
jgi:ATP-dependent Clp protease ATP-binding subunit ClpA